MIFYFFFQVKYEHLILKLRCSISYIKTYLKYLFSTDFKNSAKCFKFYSLFLSLSLKVKFHLKSIKKIYKKIFLYLISEQLLF